MVCGNSLVNIVFYVSFFIAIIGAINWGLSAANASQGGMNIIHRLLGTKNAHTKSGVVDDTPAAYSDRERQAYWVIAASGVIAAITLFMKESGCMDRK